MTNQSTVRIARPEKVCMSMESEFLLLISPASKKPSAGVISITKAVEIRTHEVSAAYMATIHQNCVLHYIGFGIIIGGTRQEE
jgi:hypothetical protein